MSSAMMAGGPGPLEGVVITNNLSSREWAAVFGDPKMATALLDRLIRRCHIVEISNISFRFKASAAVAALEKRQ